MAREIPEAVRAVAGLAATVLDEARKLPETLPGLPVRVLGMAMQLSMKVQQHYAGLVARGDELFTGLRGEEEPGLATFDEDVEAVAAPGFRDSSFDRAGAAAAEEDFYVEEDLYAETADTMTELDVTLQVEATAEVLEEFAIDEMVQDRPVTEDAGAVEHALLESDRAREEPEAAAPEATAPEATAPEAAAPEAAAPEAAAPEAAAPEAAAPEAPQVHDTAGDAEASARAARAASIVVHEGEIAVDDALGTGDGERTAPAATAAPITETAASTAPPATPPVDGYDDFSIAQLRGRLRGFAAPTVQRLLAYEEATRAREPYLRMLRNRLEKVATS